MDKIDNLFKRNVEPWRTGSSIAWAALIAPIATVATFVLGSFDPIHPLSWIFACFSACISIQQSFLVSMVAVIVALVALADTKHFSVRPVVLSTRLQYAWHILHPRSLVQLAGHALAGGAIVWCCTQMVGGRYQYLTDTCHSDSGDDENPCVNEHHIFPVSFGALVGGMYMVHFQLYNAGHIIFPIIKQSKFFEAKSKMSGILYSSIHHAAWLLGFHIIIYYLFLGAFLKNLVMDAFWVKEMSYNVDSLAGLLDPALMWQSLLGASLVYFLFTASALFYTIYHTESNMFPVESILEEEADCLLQNAISSKYPLVQYLGYLDLFELSKHSAVRRQQLFSLSQPGGHPHSWKAVSGRCLDLLQALALDVRNFNDNVMVSGPTRQLSGDAGSSKPKSVRPETLTYNTHGSTDQFTPVSSLGPALKLKVKAYTKKIVDHLKKRKAVAFFFQDLPDTVSQRLYADCQLYIWAVEAISTLALASYSEDKFGVVQKSLQDILTTLLSLQEAVDKQLKLSPPSFSRKTAKPGDLPPEVAQRYALRASLRASIYRIVITFKKHLGSIGLPAEHMRKLKLFQEFKE